MVDKLIKIGVILSIIIGITVGTLYIIPEQRMEISEQIPSAKEFLEMDCEKLDHIFPEFPSKEVADAWNTKMHECINEEGLIRSPIKVDIVAAKERITEEQNNLEQMSCDQIIKRNSHGQYLSDENRKFAREKVLDCSDIEESFAVNASCEELYERYHSGQGYWFEGHKTITENRLTECSRIEQ